jgi:hypothetical protein
MTSAYPLSSPVYNAPSVNDTPPPAPAVSSRETASSSNAYEPDRVTISPAAQQAMKTSAAVDDSGDGQR